MLTPTFVQSNEDSSGWAKFPPGAVAAGTDLATLGLHIAGTNPKRFVLWNGHQFETIEGTINGSHHAARIVYPYDKPQPHEYLAHWYYPIDPRITETDVLRATVAYPNDTNTGWLFAHCDADAMIDYEHELVAAGVGAFAHLLDLAQVKVNEATNPTVKTDAVANHYALFEFRETVLTSVLVWCRSLHIGWQEQNPHEAHVHRPILKALQEVAQLWQATRPDMWRKVNARVGQIETRLSRHYAYETRWDQAARLAAEAKAAAEAEAEGA